MKLNKNLAVSESGFLFNPTTGDSFSANPLGAEVINLLKQDISVDEIKKSIIEKYDVDKPSLEKDMDDFIAQLRENNLLNNGN